MRCPRCDSLVDTDAVRCCECGAPLQLRDEPAPARLDVDLDLDRRRGRAGSSATRTPSPRAAAVAGSTGGPEQHDLGDLSFDPPSDEAPWTLGDRPDDAGSLDDGPLDDETVKQDAGSPDSAAWEETATAGLRDEDDEDEAEPDARVAPALPCEEPVPERAPAARVVQPRSAPTAASEIATATPTAHRDLDEDDEDDEDATEAFDDQPAVHRGRILSYASIGVAAAVALVAFLTR